MRLWLDFKRWLRKLLLELAMKRPVKWTEKLNEFLGIANRALDKLQPKEPGSKETEPEPQPPETEVDPEPEHLRRRRERHERHLRRWNGRTEQNP